MFKKECPKCDSREIKTIKESFINDLMRNLLNVMFPIRFFTSRGKKPAALNVCRNCEFAWEDRK